MRKISILILFFLLSCTPKKQDIILSHHFSGVSGSGADMRTHHYVYTKYYHPRYHTKKHLIGLAKKYFDSVYAKDKSIYSIKFIYSNNFEKSFDDTDWGYVGNKYVFFVIGANKQDETKLDTSDILYYPNRYSWW